MLVFKKQKLPDARDACSSWNTQPPPVHLMSRAVIAEAVLKNILHYFDNTKSQRKGSVISCRNFLLGICFHKHSFPQGSYSLTKISALTKIDRRVISTHMKSKEILKNICYKPFAKSFPSNYWGKCAVSILVRTSCPVRKIFVHVLSTVM